MVHVAVSIRTWVLHVQNAKTTTYSTQIQENECYLSHVKKTHEIIMDSALLTREQALQSLNETLGLLMMRMELDEANELMKTRYIQTKKLSLDKSGMRASV